MKITLLPLKGENAGRSDWLSISFALTILILNFLDATLTMAMLAHPVWGNIPEEIMELNPLWQRVIENFGMAVFMISKTVFVFTILGFVLLARKNFCRVMLAFIIGYYTNLVVLQITHIWMFTHQLY